MGIGNFFNDVSNKVTTFINDKKEQYEIYNQMIENSKLFNFTNEITINNDNICEGNIKEYTNMCSYINNEIAKNIDTLIPITECVIYICYAIQKKNNEGIVLVFTDQRIIVISSNKYLIYNYQDITKFELINKALMSQVINFNDIILEIDLNQDDLKIIYNLIMNLEYRNNYIMDKIKYLCGIIPTYQRLNSISSGISIDSNNTIVFHDKKENNYLCKYEDINNYELLEDNTPVLKKKIIGEARGMGSVKKECASISIRITLNGGKIFHIRILEASAFNNMYSHMDTEYINNYNFAKDIILKLDEMNPKNYY